MKKLLYIIRHGETDLNKKGIVQGRGVNSPLNVLGKQQAQAFYHHYRNIPFDKIYTSTLLRTHQTVAQFIDDGIEWEQVAGFDEISWGIYEGREQTPELIEGFNALTNGWCKGELDTKIENGETPNQVKTRLEEALDYVLERHEEQRVLICMHGRAIRLLLCLLTGQELSKMDEFPHTNTALYKVQFENSQFEIVDFYNTSHLDHLAP